MSIHSNTIVQKFLEASFSYSDGGTPFKPQKSQKSLPQHQQQEEETNPRIQQLQKQKKRLDQTIQQEQKRLQREMAKKTAERFISAAELSDQQRQQINDISESVTRAGIDEGDFVVDIESVPPTIKIKEREVLDIRSLPQIARIPGLVNMKAENNNMILTLRL